MLNIIWAGFFLTAFVAAVFQSLGGNPGIWQEMTSALFAAAQNSFTIAINLTGILCLWLGLLKIAEEAGLTGKLAALLRPLFRKIMPEVPENSPALNSILMNMAANFLGLDNAATPMGLKAMEQLQEINPHKERASNAQILFMVLNSSAVTLVPISILMYRSELGATDPSAVFVPILFATSASTLVGFLSVAAVQKLNIFNKVTFAYLLGFILLICGAAVYFNSLPAAERVSRASNASNMILCGIIALFILSGVVKRLNVYDVFICGAKEGFEVAVRIIPYLVAMLTAIALFRASGMMDYVLNVVTKLLELCGADTAFVPALPTALLKPLSGSGARAMMIEAMQNYGADSFPAFVSCIVQGSTETTFYVLAVYFGAVKISRTGAALPCALLADVAGITAAIICGYWFYN